MVLCKLSLMVRWLNECSSRPSWVEVPPLPSVLRVLAHQSFPAKGMELEGTPVPWG